MLETVENKAKFLAQYLGQIVLSISPYFPLYKVGKSYFTSWNINRSCLVLKNLRDISDEDAIEVAKILVDDLGHDTEYPANLGRRFVLDLNNTYYKNVTIQVIDYLRSRSYLVPFMGLPVEEIIARGWAKYKQL